MSKLNVTNFLKLEIRKTEKTRQELAKILGIKYGTFTAMIMRGKIPNNRRIAFAKLFNVAVDKIDALHGEPLTIILQRRVNILPLLKSLATSNITYLTTSDLNKLLKIQRRLDNPLSSDLIQDILKNK